MRVEFDVVALVELVSDHEEFTVRAIHSKITRQLSNI